MARIYVSYRRGLGPKIGGLVDRLSAELRVEPEELVVGPQEGLTTEALQRELVDCVLMLVVIDPAWLPMIFRAATAGEPPSQIVRDEIKTAAELSVSLVSVLLPGAERPLLSDLPVEAQIVATSPFVRIGEGRESNLSWRFRRLRHDWRAAQSNEKMGRGVLSESTRRRILLYGEQPPQARLDPNPRTAPAFALPPVAREDETESGRTDDVVCSVFAPASVARSGPFLIQVFAHVEADRQRVTDLAASYDASASPRGSTSLDPGFVRGAQLTFALTLKGAEVDEPAVQSLRWLGLPRSVQFSASVLEGYRGGSIIGTVTVSDHGAPIGHLKFVVSLAREEDDQLTPGPAVGAWHRYRHAFISYASGDRAEVLKRVQMLDRVSIDFFQDLLSLEPGERWEKALYKEIDRADVFFLFWSTAAKNSEWVLKEIRYAIDRHAGDDTAPPEIIPVPIEGPPLVSPPPELKDLHFNDKFLYFIAGS